MQPLSQAARRIVADLQAKGRASEAEAFGGSSEARISLPVDIDPELLADLAEQGGDVVEGRDTDHGTTRSALNEHLLEPRP